MKTVTSEVYEYSIFQTEENMINKENYGFIAKSCDLFKLTIAHILIHCFENKEIFSDTQLNNISVLANKLQYGKTI